MATVHGTLNQPVDEAAAAVRATAAEHGYALAEGGGGNAQTLVFKKGVSLFSWGSQLTVALAATNPTTTRLTIDTRETFAMFDWGRGERAATKLLQSLGAAPD